MNEVQADYRKMRRIEGEFGIGLLLRLDSAFGQYAAQSFKRIKQPLHILVTTVKMRLNLDASLYTLLRILSVTLFAKMPLQHAFPGRYSKWPARIPCNQPNVFVL